MDADAEVHSLSGAYVLDAVSDAERAAFEQHLGQCDACTQEVAELREAVTRLALAASTEPPPALKSAVMARIGEIRQLPPEGEASVTTVTTPHRFAGSRLALRLSSAAAAVLLVTATVLGVLLVRERQALEDSRLAADSVSELLRAGDAQVTSRDTTDGRMTVVMSRFQDTMLLLADEVPDPPSDRDYQVWKMGERAPVSAGLLRPQSGRATLDVSGIGATEQIGVTIEPSGGSPQPTTSPILVVELP